MYPLTCHAGFNVPARSGKFEIVGFTVVAKDIDEETQVVIVDDPAIDRNAEAGFILSLSDINPPTQQKNIIANEKFLEGDGGPVNATIKWFPPEPIKTRYGTSLAFHNIQQGSFCLYVR